jgi:hypothetical protein
MNTCACYLKREGVWNTSNFVQSVSDASNTKRINVVVVCSYSAQKLNISLLCLLLDSKKNKFVGSTALEVLDCCSHSMT